VVLEYTTASANAEPESAAMNTRRRMADRYIVELVYQSFYLRGSLHGTPYHGTSGGGAGILRNGVLAM